MMVVIAWMGIMFLLMPLLVSIPISLTPHAYLSMPDDSLSLTHYRDLFGSAEWGISFLQSFLIAALSTLIAVTLGTLCAIGLWKISSHRGESVRLLILFPLIVPPIVSALVFYRLWGDLGLLDSYIGMILAHAILAVPYVVVAVSASLSTLGIKTEQASRNLGANLYQTLRYVIIPSIKPGVMSAAIFAFILSWDELVVTLFISSRHIYTLPRRMWDGMRENVDPTIAVVSTLLILLTSIFILIGVIRQRKIGVY